MKLRLPLILCFLCGIFMIVQFFVPPFTGVYDKLLNWVMIISIPALVIGVTSLIKLHSTRIIRKTPNMPYSIVAFVAMIVMALSGLIGGTDEGTWFEWMFTNIQVPMQATMFSLLAFYIASAAYRAFRARTLEATLMLVTAVIVMLARVPIGNFLWHLIMPDSNLPEQVSGWILNVPSMAARRGIILGISLGAIATSIKIILGIERSYMGAGE
ncbi:MAG: hypothetical protein QG641_1959 [Candidatus Poribacteria bacterium]|nr:hypothetical protein [Candidatus Poribacteria bacterium]